MQRSEPQIENCRDTIVRMILVVVAAAGVMALTVGCDKEEPDRAAMSPAEFFNATQSDMHTPDGRYVQGSAEDMPNGDVRYQTEDGSTHELTPVANVQGGYRYVNAEEVENGR